MKVTLIYPNGSKSHPKVAKRPQNILRMTPKSLRLDSSWRFLGGSWFVKVLEMFEKCVFPVYGPVWDGHKAILYALHVPMAVYMAKVNSK